MIENAQITLLINKKKIAVQSNLACSDSPELKYVGSVVGQLHLCSSVREVSGSHFGFLKMQKKKY